MRKPMIAALALLMAGTAAAQTTPPPGEPASIPMVRLDNIRDFHPDGERGVWLQDRARNWYYARIAGSCFGLPQATAIGVDTRFGGNALDSTGTLLVDGERCRIDRLTASGPPTKKARHRD